MLHPLTIKFPLNFFIPEKFGLTRAQADYDPDLFANNVAESLGKIFQKIGQNARIAVTTSSNSSCPWASSACIGLSRRFHNDL